jgi:mRNA interferase MazF
MPKKVRIPTPLRKLTNGEELVEVNAATIGDAITESLARIAASLFDGDAQILFDAISDRKRDEYVRSALTSIETDATLFRPVVQPDDHNGLRSPTRLMTDKLMTLPRMKVEKRIGRLAEADMVRLNQAILIFLGLAGG